MLLAKPLFDVAVNVQNAEVNRTFWEQDIQLPFSERLDIGGGAFQDRYAFDDAIIKVISYPSIPVRPPGGYHELIIARVGAGQKQHVSPDGALVSIGMPGFCGVQKLGLRYKVRDPGAHRQFFQKAFGLPLNEQGCVVVGDGQFMFEQSDDAPVNATLEGAGWRCITIQVMDLAVAHSNAVRGGARVAIPPTRFGDIALYSMIQDPDGNWIELSQRASLIGPLA